MKICPTCSFQNDERFPTCVFCNAVLVDVPSTPSADPADPEHGRRALLADRHATMGRELRFAGMVYALAIVVIALVPGLVFNPLALLLYGASAVVVAVAVARGTAGQFSASFLQALLSVILVLWFGPKQPLIFFMLLGHVVLPGFLLHWMELIHGAHR